ncbi:copper chaperone [Halovivax ruber XH-70]|uniref:Copper chaperone n=1 Tax=Halovivax ruber (strain DSM 18193 / JCM 13892 / XH-70) TaxID=797302 RepID=L0IF15_HALRX|nr:cation transporter [Halovivax ruber]AGB16572.1 copper chaperone [Halovivax ruber XH-70]
MVQTTLSVDGMSCGGCEQNVVSALTELDGVSDASADHETGDVSVEHESPAVDEATISATIEDAGYDVAN